MARRFGDIDTALSLRDLVQRMARGAVETLRPKARYAKVTGINRGTRTCTVRYTGDDGTVTVNMGNLQPSALGQTVRIEGVTGDRYITDVMGPVYLDAATGTVSAAPTVPTSLVNRSYVDAGDAGSIRTGAIIPVGANLDTYRTTGVHMQGSDAGAAAGSNYPPGGVRAGFLEVFAPSAAWTFQRYTTYQSSMGMPITIYIRSRYNSETWVAWRKVTDTVAA